MDTDRFDTLLRSFAETPSRRRALGLLAGSALAGLLSLGRASTEAKKDKGKGKGKKKITICHKGQTIRIAKSAWKEKGHKKHGDSKGPCPTPSPPPPSGPNPPPPSGPTCLADGITNGSETDIDCGGGTCPRCGVGKTCASRNDCASARCAGTPLTCQTCVDPMTDCGTDTNGGMCACRDHESGQRFCTKANGRFLPAGTPCTVCQGGEQCFPINGGVDGIECILPCGA